MNTRPPSAARHLAVGQLHPCLIGQEEARVAIREVEQELLEEGVRRKLGISGQYRNIEPQETLVGALALDGDGLPAGELGPEGAGIEGEHEIGFGPQVADHDLDLDRQRDPAALQGALDLLGRDLHILPELVEGTRLVALLALLEERQEALLGILGNAHLESDVVFQIQVGQLMAVADGDEIVVGCLDLQRRRKAAVELAQEARLPAFERHQRHGHRIPRRRDLDLDQGLGAVVLGGRLGGLGFGRRPAALQPKIRGKRDGICAFGADHQGAPARTFEIDHQLRPQGGRHVQLEAQGLDRLGRRPDVLRRRRSQDDLPDGVAARVQAHLDRQVGQGRLGRLAEQGEKLAEQFEDGFGQPSQGARGGAGLLGQPGERGRQHLGQTLEEGEVRIGQIWCRWQGNRPDQPDQLACRLGGRQNELDGIGLDQLELGHLRLRLAVRPEGDRQLACKGQDQRRIALGPDLEAPNDNFKRDSQIVDNGVIGFRLPNRQTRLKHDIEVNREGPG